MNFQKIILICLSLFFHAQLSPHFFFLEKWTNGSHTLYLLGDYHLATKPENMVRKKQMDDLVNAIKKHTGKLVVEDGFPISLEHYDPMTFEINDYVKSLESIQKLANHITPLLGLSSLCRHHNIRSINVDYHIFIGASIA